MCTVLITNSELSFADEQSFILLSFDGFWSCLFLTAFERLLVTLFSLYIYKSVEKNSIDCSFQFKCQSFYFSFDFIFIWRLSCNSVFIINLAIFEFFVIMFSWEFYFTKIWCIVLLLTCLDEVNICFRFYQSGFRIS